MRALKNVEKLRRFGPNAMRKAWAQEQNTIVNMHEKEMMGKHAFRKVIENIVRCGNKFRYLNNLSQVMTALIPISEYAMAVSCAA
jgi:hypothetical protein